MKRAVIYTRVSSRIQEEDGTSLDTQEQYCRNLAEQQGIPSDHIDVVREVFTGFELTRPQLDKVRQRIRAGQVSHLIIYATDRLARKNSHLFILWEEAREQGVEVISCTDTLDDTALGRLNISILGFAAELERERILDRSRRGHEAREARGLLRAGQRPPYGYMWIDEEGNNANKYGKKAYLTPDPNEAPVVRWIVNQLLSGQSVSSTCRELTKRGIPTPMGKKYWYASNLKAMLQNPVYKGCAEAGRYRDQPLKKKGYKVARVYEGRPLPNAVREPLLSPEVWEALQFRFEEITRLNPRNAKNPEATLLRQGFVYCGLCGRLMRTINRSTRGCYIYACKWNVDRVHGPSIRTNKLDAAVWGFLTELMRDEERIRAFIERKPEDDPTVDQRRLFERRLKELHEEANNLEQSLALLKNPAAVATIAHRYDDTVTQIEDLEKEYAYLVEQSRRWSMSEEEKINLISWCNHVGHLMDEMDWHMKRQLLSAMSVKVTVYPKSHGVRATISWRFPGSIEEQVEVTADRLDDHDSDPSPDGTDGPSCQAGFHNHDEESVEQETSESPSANDAFRNETATKCIPKFPLVTTDLTQVVFEVPLIVRA